MYKLSIKATKDIQDIIEYTIKDFGYDTMLAYYNSLEKCLYTLSENPDIGLNYNHIDSGYLCFYHRSHAIFYKEKGDDIFIIRILNKNMDIPQHLS
jgi:toxin ParE1/3/4